MGAISHMGDMIGATPPIDDSSVSDKKLWSSQKTRDEIDAHLACPATTAGTYTLKCTVDAQGNKTYSWVGY